MVIMPVSSVQFKGSGNNINFEGRKKEGKSLNSDISRHASMPLKSIPVIALIATSPIDAAQISKFYPVDEPVRTEMVQSGNEKVIVRSPYFKDGDVYRAVKRVSTDSDYNTSEKIVVGTYTKGADGTMNHLYDANIDIYESGHFNVHTQLGYDGGFTLLWSQASGVRDDGKRDVYEDKNLCLEISKYLNMDTDYSNVSEVKHGYQSDLAMSFDIKGSPVFVVDSPEYKKRVDAKTLPAVSYASAPVITDNNLNGATLKVYRSKTQAGKYDVTYKQGIWPELRLVNFCEYDIKPVVRHESRTKKAFVMTLEDGDGKAYNFISIGGEGKYLKRALIEIGDFDKQNVNFFSGTIGVNK